MDEVVDRLWYQGSVPTFVDISIFRSEKKATIFNLFTDSRYKSKEDDIYHISEGYPPFHVVLEIPVYMDPNDGSKFDVNWRHNKCLLKFMIWKRKRELNKRKLR